MELTSLEKQTITHQFDSFCKKVLRCEARDYIRHIKWRSKHEVSFSELLVEQMMELCVLDEYPSEQFHFQVQGFSITVKDEKLANALTALSEEKRSIVMLSYFMNMTDQEIGDRLNIVRRTVQYKRTSSLKEMKRMLELDI